jgi:hypothetical protein
VQQREHSNNTEEEANIELIKVAALFLFARTRRVASTITMILHIFKNCKDRQPACTEYHIHKPTAFRTSAMVALALARALREPSSFISDSN